MQNNGVIDEKVHDIDVLPDRESARIVATVTAAVKLRSWLTFSDDAKHTDGHTISTFTDLPFTDRPLRAL
jgi:hypothetical protein